MAPVRKTPLSEAVHNKIQAHVKMHCEAFASDTVYLDTIGRIPGGRVVAESQSWPIREAFEYFQHLGVGRLEGDAFKVLDPDYFNIDKSQVIVSFSFSIDERLRSELHVMLDVYAQLYDAENQLRFYLNQKLQEKFGPNFVPHLPHHVQERIALEKSRNNSYVIDPRRGELEFVHLSDLKRIIVANEEFITSSRSRSVLVQKLDYLNSIRHLAAHNNLILPAEVTRIRYNCEIVRLIITGAGVLDMTQSPAMADDSETVTSSGRFEAPERRVSAGGDGDVRSEHSHSESAVIP